MKKIIIQNATIYTMSPENDTFFGWVLIENGKIADMGTENPPQADQTIDGNGGILMPGLIDAHTHLGLYEDSLGFEGADGNEDTDPVTPQMRALDGVNPMDRGFQEAIASGITTVAVSPGSANPIGGQIAVMKTAGRRVDDMLLAAPAAIKVAFGENPKSVYHEKDESPTTRMATAALVRENLFKAKEYLESKRKALEEDEDMPDFDMKLEALVPLLEGKIPAHIHAHRADDIFTALRIAKEFGFRVVLVHGTEGHLIADLLAKEQIPIISGPHMTDRSKPELQNLSDASPKRLREAGVQTALTVDHPETPIRLLLTAASLAVKAGMTEFDALSGITRIPANILGMDNRIGIIRPGMDADLVLFSGNPLDFRTTVEYVWIGGAERFRRRA